MTTVIASAPGKAILSGEYVVLLGALAISAAVDRRVIVKVEPRNSEYHSVSSPGLYGATEFSVSRANGALHWRDKGASQDFRLFECVWRCCSPAVNRSLDIQIDSRTFFDEDSGIKYGFGSSAAVACALTFALCEFAESTMDEFALAHAANLDYQRNSGSGVDIATSMAGGVIEYANVSHPETRELEPVDDLLMQFFWSGKATATTSQVRKFLGGGDNHRSNTQVAALTEHSSRVATAWRRGRATGVLSAMSDYVAALAQFSEEFDLNIFAAGHDQMSRLARDSGIVYKPCGAGGGDIGVAMAIDETQLQTFRKKAEILNFETLDCDIDRYGASLETSS